MQIVIDIDEDEYEFCKRCVESELPKEMTTVDMVAFKVGKGIPLSEYCDHCAGDKAETEDD